VICKTDKEFSENGIEGSGVFVVLLRAPEDYAIYKEKNNILYLYFQLAKFIKKKEVFSRLA